jgi:hypothetical protein
MRGVTFSEALASAEYPPSTPIHAILKTTRVDRAGGVAIAIEALLLLSCCLKRMGVKKSMHEESILILALFWSPLPSPVSF